MRIAMYGINPDKGGGTHYLERVGESLRKKGHEIRYLLVDTNKNVPSIRRWSEGEYERLESSTRLAAFARVLTRQPRHLRWLLKERPSWLRAVPPLAKYLSNNPIDMLLVAQHHQCFSALLANEVCDRNTKVVVSVNNHITEQTRRKPKRRERLLHQMLALYPTAHRIIAVSNGVADDLVALTGFDRSRVSVVYNPVVTPSIQEQAAELTGHPWLDESGPPVVLAAGRLVPQKGFDVLLRAFTRVRRTLECRLIILGAERPDEVGEKQKLLDLAKELKISSDVDFPGVVKNPFAYMARAKVFALSSRFEGFGNVVAEALACGCTVVSTDCPSGPAEILEYGQYGYLVQPDDYEALASGILIALQKPMAPESLKVRAQLFSADVIAEHWIK